MIPLPRRTNKEVVRMTLQVNAVAAKLMKDVWRRPTDVISR